MDDTIKTRCCASELPVYSRIAQIKVPSLIIMPLSFPFNRLVPSIGGLLNRTSEKIFDNDANQATHFIMIQYDLLRFC